MGFSGDSVSPMNFNASVWCPGLCSALGELAKTQGDAFVSRSIFQIPLFRVFPPLFPSSLQATSFTLGPNELRSLVVIGSQMCCWRCQCHGMPRRVMQTHAGSHAGGDCQPANGNANDAPPRFHLLFPQLSFAFPHPLYSLAHAALLHGVHESLGSQRSIAALERASE